MGITKNRTFTHVKTPDTAIEKNLRLSWLHQYVSAYEPSETMVSQLRDDLIEGLRRSKETTEQVIVGQDGEHFFVCNPSGTISLCAVWKRFEPVWEEIV